MFRVPCRDASPTRPTGRRGRAALALVAAAVFTGTGWLGLPGAAVADDAANLVRNGDFEGGDTAGWSCQGNSAVTAGVGRGGSHALVSTPGNADTAPCAQTVAVRPNATYAVRVWVMGAYAQMAVTGAGVRQATWTGSSTWKQLTLDVSTGATTTELTLTVSGWYASGALEVDDVVITALPGAPGPSPTGSGAASPAPPQPSATATSTPAPAPSTSSPAPTVPPTPGPSGGATVRVSNGSQLKAALAAAVPGQTIELQDGSYSGNFKITTGGTASAPITLTGSRAAVLTTPTGGGNGIQFTSAPYWVIKGITVTGGQKGIMIDSSDHVVVDSVEIHHTTMEGLHFRTSSSFGVVRNSHIHDTGTSGNGMGEGVYVGTANTLTDASDHVRILDNRIGPNIGGENIDIKEGTRGGLISGNFFDGNGLTGVHYDDSWVDIKGNGYTVENNRGVNTTNDGFQTHSQDPGWGCGTVFRNNTADLTGAGGTGRHAIEVTNYDPSGCPATVTADNRVIGGDGLVNPGVPVT
jgi:hypothetical protein